MTDEKRRERIRRIQDMRRSNATEPIRNRKRYSRKDKYPSRRYEA